MKTSTTIVSVGLCGWLTVSAMGNTSGDKASAAESAPPAKREAPIVVNEKKGTTTPTPSAAKGEVSKTWIADPVAAEITDQAKREHIVPGGDLHRMETPPPAARKETRPKSPEPGLVWVPGHWRPVQGEWTWVNGEWGFPPTPVSVWIEPKYDPVTKQWSAGYWQPDREEPYVEESSQDDPLPIVKF